MKNNMPTFKIGEVVEVLMGREKGKYMVVLGLNQRFVSLVDGDKRKFDKPKKKNLRHIRSTGYISEQVNESLAANGRVSNAKLRYVLQDYISNHLNREGQKGE